MQFAEHPSGFERPDRRLWHLRSRWLFGRRLWWRRLGGSDLLYFPAQRNRAGLADAADHDAAFARKIVGLLLDKSYVSGVFVDTERFGEIPGALALADISSAALPARPRPPSPWAFARFPPTPRIR